MWGCTTSPRFNPLKVPISTSRLCPRQNYRVWMSVPNFSAHARTHTRTHTHARAHTRARAHTHTHTHHARVRATKSCCHPHPPNSSTPEWINRTKAILGKEMGMASGNKTSHHAWQQQGDDGWWKWATRRHVLLPDKRKINDTLCSSGLPQWTTCHWLRTHADPLIP